jgi:hypothetical protein
MRVTCERCLRRYDVPDATVKGRKIRARCKCGARVVVQDEERAARSSAGGSQTTGSIQRPVRWFVDITSWEPIAMDLRQLVRAFDGGRIDADTLVWRKGMPDWRRLRDVAELAERLMGADAAKAAVPDPALDSVRAEAEPPPRHAEKQPERSRTPAANYSVGGSQGRGSVPPGPASLERISVSSGSEELVAATLPGGSMPATPAGGYSSPAPPRTSTRPERRSVPSPAPTPLAGRAPIMGEPPRTITQTGLAPAPDPAHRLVHSVAAEAPITEEPEATRAGSAAAGTPRASRTPAPGPRRVPSSDETPAQKPSSISVPSGALAAAPLRLRTKHLVALGGLVLGVVFIVRGTLSSESANGASASNGSPEPHAMPPAGLPEPPHVENRNALIPEPSAALREATEPAPAVAVLVPAATRTPTAESVAPAPTQRPARAAVSPLPAKPLPAPAARAEAPVLDIRPSEPARGAVATVTGESSPVTGRGELGAPDTASQAEPVAPQPVAANPVAANPVAANPVTPQPVAPQPVAPQPVAPQPVAANPAAPPAAATASRTQPAPAAAPTPVSPAPVAPSTAPASAAPAPFDLQLAKVQLGIAAFKASTCGRLGVTRGAGDLTVVIESFGRATRVTHLNPAFVGSPVGSCITQAYQQVQVPPFSGAAQTLTSSFFIP